MSASTATSTLTATKRKSERIANAPVAKQQKTEKKVTPRGQWLLDNEEYLDGVYQQISDYMKQKYGENGVKPEGKRSFTNFCEVLCEEMCSGVARIVNDDSTDDEDEVTGLGSEDEPEGEFEDDYETDEDDGELPELNDDPSGEDGGYEEEDDDE